MERAQVLLQRLDYVLTHSILCRVFNTNRLAFRRAWTLQVALREGAASQPGPSVSTGQSWMGLRPRLLRLSGCGQGGGAGHGLQLRAAVTRGRVISGSAGETPPGTQRGAPCSPGARPFGGSSDSRASPGVCPASAVPKTPGLGTQEAATQ